VEDGGGVRGRSAIIMLEHIVDKANDCRADQGLPALEPRQMFDMIGGTSTGG
jgi:patatin-like phospholipase/acyl hydrolase